MMFDDSCIYQISIPDYVEGDLIELDVIMIDDVDITVYSGKNSLSKMVNKTNLSVINLKNSSTWGFPTRFPIYIVVDFVGQGS